MILNLLSNTIFKTYWIKEDEINYIFVHKFIRVVLVVGRYKIYNP